MRYAGAPACAPGVVGRPPIDPCPLSLRRLNPRRGYPGGSPTHTHATFLAFPLGRACLAMRRGAAFTHAPAAERGHGSALPALTRKSRVMACRRLWGSYPARPSGLRLPPVAALAPQSRGVRPPAPARGRLCAVLRGWAPLRRSAPRGKITFVSDTPRPRKKPPQKKKLHSYLTHRIHAKNHPQKKLHSSRTHRVHAKARPHYSEAPTVSHASYSIHPAQKIVVRQFQPQNPLFLRQQSSVLGKLSKDQPQNGWSLGIMRAGFPHA